MIRSKVDKREDHEEGIWGGAWDDVTGTQLDRKEVMKARATELGYVKLKKVWTKIPRSVAVARGWKIIKTRWIDINKGDITNPNYRSRFVGKEFNNGVEEGLFAATPPLEALKAMISELATEDEGEVEETVLMINDVARAFFEAGTSRDICIELPEEDKIEGEGDMVGKLRMSLYGTRDAAANFQEEVRRFMVKLGFKQGKYNPCTYWHKERRIRTLVHGDDFVSKASRKEAGWLKKKMEERFEIKTKLIGNGRGEVKEERVLNRVIRVTPEGWEYEPDQRHAELLVSALDLKQAKAVQTPWEEDRPWKEAEEDMPLQEEEVRKYRSLAARANYLALDRCDIQYAVKEICRGMANPTRKDYRRLKRLGRYLVGRPRMVARFPWQKRPGRIDAYSDSDWAGCRRTAKSTSGGALVVGSHCIKTWSSTQKSITLSSGEAELVAAVKASTETIGLIQLMQDWGIELEGVVLVDSSAALGVVKRKGCGKLRHIRVGLLWIQEKEESCEIAYKKVHGEQNPADLMTKGVPPKLIQRHMAHLGLEPRAGRAKTSLEVAEG